MNSAKWLFAVALLCLGCTTAPNAPSPNKGTPTGPLPVFRHATSEYPSWSTYMVAGKAGLINAAEGGTHGTLEQKWGVDVVLEVKDYDPCLTLYGQGTVDSVCITNIDVLNPSLRRKSTAICPTSTSVGGDKIIAVGVNNLTDLSTPVYGLSRTVSEYLFVRALDKASLDRSKYKFENLDPAAAATALQTGSSNVKAICVWNPYALQTLRSTPNSKVLVDSSAIPEEIIDMVVIGNDALQKPSGKNFAYCLCDIFYEVNKRLADSNTGDATLQALGEDFCKLPLADMRIVVKDTRFYSTPKSGRQLFAMDSFKDTMKVVVKTCKEIQIIDKEPTIGYGDELQNLNFDTQYMEKVQ